MYTKVHTEGIILKCADYGETERAYHIFTRDLGLIYAKARGVRTLKSRLRYALQPLSRAELSLVRAREHWKITSARPMEPCAHTLSQSRDHYDAIVRVLSLFRKLVQGEEPAPRLYNLLTDVFSYLNRHSVSASALAQLEVLTVLRMLHELGYLGDPSTFEYLIASSHVNDILLHETSVHANRAISEINRALKEIQL